MSQNEGPEFQLHMARVYLNESRSTKHRGWSFTLLSWAGDCRRRAMAMRKRAPVQADLFGGVS